LADGQQGISHLQVCGPWHGKELEAALPFLPSWTRGGKASSFFGFPSAGTLPEDLRYMPGGGLGTNSI